MAVHKRGRRLSGDDQAFLGVTADDLLLAALTAPTPAAPSTARNVDEDWYVRSVVAESRTWDEALARLIQEGATDAEI